MNSFLSNLSHFFVFLIINFSCKIPITDSKNCEGFGECVIFSGYVCKNNKCVCDPDEPSLFRCIPPKFYGERCNSDQECQLEDYNLHCLKSDIRICKCKRSYVWDLEKKKCLPTLDDDMYSGKFDPVRDLIIPGLIIITIGAMIYLGFKLSCNCGKLWRRRRHQEIARELEEISSGPHQQAWIASYRVFSPYNNSNRPTPLSSTSFPIHPTPCMGVFVPSQSLSQSPPPYEEALKHKVILSSYHSPGLPVVPTYSHPPSEVPRHYQTVSPNPSGSTPIILNPTTTTSLKAHSTTGRRPYPIVQNESYEHPVSNEWDQVHYSEATQQLWNPNYQGLPSCRIQGSPGHSETLDRIDSRVPWVLQQRIPQLPTMQTQRPGLPQKMYHGNNSITSGSNNDRNN